MGNTYSSTKPSLPALNLSKVRSPWHLALGRLEGIRKCRYSSKATSRCSRSTPLFGCLVAALSLLYWIAVLCCRSSRHQTTQTTCT